jgi:histidine triad (HIT) family protein
MTCIFCEIAEHKMKASVVYENDKVMAFDDIAPQAPVHVVIIPKKHITEVRDIGGHPEIFAAVEEVARIKGLTKDGFRLVLNKGSKAGQSVDHLHFHLLGGRVMKWPPG